jgi:uncharacterized protein YbaR (Trm112 family)
VCPGLDFDSKSVALRSHGAFSGKHYVTQRPSGATHTERIMAVSEKLLEILVCPKCKGDLVLTPPKDGLICGACKLNYPIRDDIPIMLIDEALPLEPDAG